MKRVIITGAASGIGRATARNLALAGGHALLLVDRDAEGLAHTAGALTGAEAVEVLAGDLSLVSFPQKVVDACVRLFGGVDGVVSNAGALRTTSVLELSADDFDLLFAINTRATWLLAKAAHPHLKASRGAIVATASLAASHPAPNTGVYPATKAALVMLIRQMALEWGPDGIRCNTVSPGPTPTAMTAGLMREQVRDRREQSIPLGRLSEAEDIADAIAFLLSDRARQITGQDLLVDGGISSSLMSPR